MCTMRLTGFLAGDCSRLAASGSSAGTRGWLMRRAGLAGSVKEQNARICYRNHGQEHETAQSENSIPKHIKR